MQNPMREFGILGDLAQAGAGVAQFRERLQSGLGEFGPTLGELVDPLAWNSVEFCHSARRHFGFAVSFEDSNEG